MDLSRILSADYLSLLFWINLYTHTHLYVEDVGRGLFKVKNKMIYKKDYFCQSSKITTHYANLTLTHYDDHFEKCAYMNCKQIFSPNEVVKMYGNKIVFNYIIC